MNRVYIDATIPSYLVARQSNNPKIAERQRVTYQFWSDDRFEFILSDYVIDEIEDGNKIQAAKRLKAIKGLPRLLVKKIDIDLAEQLINRKVMPEKAFIDAVHVAVAARNAIPYLATWNFRHLANPHIRPEIERFCSNTGYTPPLIDSPKAILEKF